MNVVRHILLLILAFILQTTWIHTFEIVGLKPDLVILLLIYIALRAGSFEATLLGFAIGFIQDVDMPDNLGLNALANSIIGFAVGWIRLHVTGDNFLVQIALIFGAVLLHDLIYCIGDSAINWSEAPFFWLRYSPGRGLYTGLIGAVLSAILILRQRLLPV
jgi:rod shape-determining protein MreD